MEAFLRGWDNGRKHRSGRWRTAETAPALGSRNVGGAGGDASPEAAAARLAPITGAGAGGDHVALTVFYNGACPVCRKHIGRFQKASAGRSRLIAWADAAAALRSNRRWPTAERRGGLCTAVARAAGLSRARNHRRPARHSADRRRPL